MHTAIEFHDSVLAAIDVTPDGVVVRLAPAYVHRADDRPEVDAGTGWSQNVELRLLAGVVVGAVPPLPCDLDDGELHAETLFRNIVPLPYSSSHAVRLVLRTMRGETVEATGNALEVRALGAARYVEEVPFRVRVDGDR
ncbi:MAG: hypothetical protein QM811_17975 [Pirellulales bacterium]